MMHDDSQREEAPSEAYPTEFGRLESCQEHQAIDENTGEPTDIASRDIGKDSEEISSNESRHRSRQADPITQSLGVLATIGLILLAARFLVPQVVEEVRYAWHRGELRAEYETGTDGLKNVSLEALSDAYEMVTAAVGPSVVHIDVSRRLTVDQASLPSGLTARLLPSSDQGSGVVVDSEGYLLTNRHVISDGEDITVTLSDGRRLPALVVGTDALTDLAVLKVDAKQLIPIAWGDSDRCRVGSPVWAVGSPFGLDRTVTFGIVSGKHRKVRASTEWQDFMQSDVAVNPGNSGGPLVDARGTLVGINTAIVGETYQGVSFSVPSNVAKKIYTRIKADGRVERGWLGVSLATVTDEQLVGGNRRLRGSRIEHLHDKTGPAARAGVLKGDIVLEVNGVAVRDTQHLMQVIGEAVPGEEVKLKIDRSGAVLEIPVVLGVNLALR
ncbi:putative serine protease HtrA [Rubripirellula obstinata]|uniref:Putative serine protease HtrA n=1 Tax=Rubripirellula obstinata TaxID=406547 RepID=A0A5B1CIC1_9BACT|nr:trypsin-like peptidase domain-containing protein [Rubripirellula obstinata]KAA1260316.1 putative serine protease HtrA [Rubripirellula obstinata]